MATPAPPSAASALTEAAAKGQAPTAPEQTCALSASLAAAPQHGTSDRSAGQAGLQSHQVRPTLLPQEDCVAICLSSAVQDYRFRSSSLYNKHVVDFMAHK